jgi:hypothetical protein
MVSATSLQEARSPMLENFANRPYFLFQAVFTLVVSGIFFWQAWIAWKEVKR